MRIISGTARGTKINSIEDISTRPTLDRVKESLYNIIQHLIKDSYVLDLFAGSGALGIEALSRGASKAVFCDNNYECFKIIKQNLEKTHLYNKANIYNLNYNDCITKISGQMKFDIIFIDPPYKADIAINATKEIIIHNLIKDNGLIIIETDEPERDENELNILINELSNICNIKLSDKRKYGRANLLFLSVNKENKDGNV